MFFAQLQQELTNCSKCISANKIYHCIKKRILAALHHKMCQDHQIRRYFTRFSDIATCGNIVRSSVYKFDRKWGSLFYIACNYVNCIISICNSCFSYYHLKVHLNTEDTVYDHGIQLIKTG